MEKLSSTFLFVCISFSLLGSGLVGACTEFSVGPTLIFDSLATTTTFLVVQNTTLVSPILDLTFSNPALNVGYFVQQNSTHFTVKSTESPATASVKLSVPSNYAFTTLTILLSSGSINVDTSISAEVVLFDICTLSSPTSSIDVSGLTISESGYFCAKSEITVTSLSQGTTSTTFNFTSDLINVSFLTPFSGTYFVNSPVAPSVTGDCTANVCRFGDSVTYASSAFTATSPNLVTLNFGITNAGLEPVAVDTIRPLPGATYVTTSVPVFVTYTDAANFIMMSQWGSGDGVRWSNATNVGQSAGVIKSYVPSWWDYTWWWGYTQSLPKLNPNITYTISFAFRQDASNLNAFKNITATVVILKSTPNPNTAVNAHTDSTKTIVNIVPTPKNFTLTSFTTFTASFTVPIMYTNSYLAFRFENPSKSGSVGLYMYFANMTISAPSVPITPPTPITQDSELVNLRKAPETFDANPRTNCPHERPGLALWHNVGTWGGTIPTSATPVITIPTNTSVLATAASFSSGVYQKIVVPVGSELIFDDSPVNLNVKYIDVRGKFWMGSSTCRLFSEITITFYGNKTINGVLQDKGIFVAPGGSIDVHGKQFHYTWTRLAVTIKPGDDKAYLLDDVNWEVGQQVVITTSVYQDEINPQNEVMTIKGKTGKILQFTSPFQFGHYGGLEYQAEVGLLTRRIVFQGDEDSIPYKYGGHVMCMGVCRFAGLRTFRMGQQNVLGRYPLHFHLAGYSPNSFVKDCAFQNTYFRCVSIHATHESLVTRNVAYDIEGHCYYIEDGVEENNTISYNLAAFIHTIYANASGNPQTGEVYYTTSELEQPADTAAAGFYITNAYNRIYGNAASGGWTGFAFPNLPKPIGVSANQSVVPQERTTLEFDGNSAHSAGYFWVNDGACIYCGGRLQLLTPTSILQYDTGRFKRTTKGPYMRWTNIKTYLCNMGVLHWGEQIEIDGYEAHDTRHSATLFGETLITNAILNGKSNNTLQSLGAPGSKQGFQFYDTGTKTILTNIQFRNYISNGQSDPYSNNFALISMTHSDIFKPSGISATRNVSFSGMAMTQRIGHRMINTGASRLFNFMDWDGTAIGRAVPALVGSAISWWRFDSSCTLKPDWNVYVCNKGSREIAYLQIIIPGLIETTQYGSLDPPLDSHKIGNVSLWGSGISDFRYVDFTRNPGVSGVTGAGWFLYLPAGTPTNFTLTLWQIPYNTQVYFALKYPSGTTFKISSKHKWDGCCTFNFTSVASMASLVSGNGKNYFFDSSHLYIKLIDLRPTAPTAYFERSGVKIYDMEGGLDVFIYATCPGAYQTGNNTYCPATNTAPTQTY